MPFEWGFEFRDDIEGWPVRGWIHRCYYHSSEEAIGDARKALCCFRELYVVRQTGGPLDVWEGGVYWIILEKPPFSGQIANDYYPLPEHYSIKIGQELHFPAEPVERR